MTTAIIETFVALADFNFGWLLAFFLDNLFFVFGFSCFVYFVFETEKKKFSYFLIILVVMILTLWFWETWGSLSGVVLFGAKTLGIYYLTKVAVLTLVATSKTLQDKYVLISSLQGVVAIFVAQLI